MSDVSNMTEQELREAKAPWPKSIEELNDYIQALKNRPHDYGTCVYAMSMAATATFNYIASELGVTGFQASCADLDFLRRSRNMDRFMILDLNEALYPQYDLKGKVDEYLETNKDYLKEEAEKLLDNKENWAHPDVVAHWRKLAERV